jgi:hypothetical protein
MLLEVYDYIESIQAIIELVSERPSDVPATPHQHEQVRQGQESSKGPQNVIGEAGQPGRDCDRD